MLHIILGINIDSCKIVNSGNFISIKGDDNEIISIGGNISITCFPEAKKHPSKIKKSVDQILARDSYDGHLVLTHSHHLINCLSEMIDNKVISNKDIKIYIIDEDFSKYETYSFTEDGYLDQGWPIGFLSTY